MRVFLMGAILAAIVATNPTAASAERSCTQVDLNGNGKVDDSDIAAFKFSIGTSVGNQRYLVAADLDESGTITPIDFLLMLSCR